MKDSQPLISIVTPTYNRADFILEAVQSVIDQSYPHWEMVIIDDGSKDDTQELLAPYIEKDNRLKYFYQENQGQSVARNRGIKESNGDYICFLDSDNKWLPEKLKVSVTAALESPDSDIIYGDNITIDIDGVEISRISMPKFSGKITSLLLKDNFISMNTTMTKRECFENLGGFNEKDRLAEDYELWLRMSTQYSFLYVPEYMGCYRVMEDQLSTDKEKRFWANERILINFRRDYPSAVTRSDWNHGFSFFYVRKALYELSEKNTLATIKISLRALCYDFFWLGPWRVLAKLCLFRR